MNVEELNTYIKDSFKEKLVPTDVLIKIDEILSLVDKHDLVKEFRLKKGICLKKFIEEIYPLKFFIKPSQSFSSSSVSCITPLVSL